MLLTRLGAIDAHLHRASVVDHALRVLREVERAQWMCGQFIQVLGLARDDVDRRLPLASVGNRRYLAPRLWSYKNIQPHVRTEGRTLTHRQTDRHDNMNMRNGVTSSVNKCSTLESKQTCIWVCRPVFV